MPAIIILQMPYFKRAYKKLHDNQKNAVDRAINDIVLNPHLGEAKKGELAGIYVYKFKWKVRQTGKLCYVQ